MIINSPIAIMGGVPVNPTFGNVTITGDLTVEGDFNFGDVGTDILTIAGYIIGSASGNTSVNIGTGTPAIITPTTDDLFVSGDLEIAGDINTSGQYNVNFPIDLGEDGGFVTLFDKAVTSASSVEESVYLDIDGEDFICLYADGDGSGGIENQAIQFFKRVNNKQGTDIASATNIVIPNDGNVFELTGTTKVDLISNIGWFEGAEITLVANENVTIDHGTATSTTNITILLAGAGDFAMTANDTLTLILCSTTAGGQAWREKCRTAI